jgi:phosphoglucosamine mutase
VANTGLTAEMAFKVGQAGALVLMQGFKAQDSKAKFLIAQDTRLSSDMLTAALTAGICSVGADVVNLGVLPTPGLAALIRIYSAAGGVMVSASHNSFEDNGIKFFTADGFKLSEDLEAEIEAKYYNPGEFKFPSGEAVGRVFQFETSVDDYAEFLMECVSDVSLKSLKIALDCANGAAYAVAPDVFLRLGASALFVEEADPDGININRDCGQTNIHNLVKYVKQYGADVGFAFDGDGDRCFAVDELGNVVDGDQIMSILALQMKERGKLAKDTVVATVMSNMGFLRAMEDNGIQVDKVTVGDKYVLQRMLERGFTLGGEQSGHIILLNHQTTGDGVLAALALASIMASKGKKLSELNTVMKKMPQITVNAFVANDVKDAVMDDSGICTEIAVIEDKYEERGGRVLVRKSGTEALIRVMIEGDDEAEITADAKKLAQKIEMVGALK